MVSSSAHGQFLHGPPAEGGLYIPKGSEGEERGRAREDRGRGGEEGEKGEEKGRRRRAVEGGKEGEGGRGGRGASVSVTKTECGPESQTHLLLGPHRRSRRPLAGAYKEGADGRNVACGRTKRSPFTGIHRHP